MGAPVSEYHGGQEWSSLENFVEDFSVTTNCFGTPKSGLDAVMGAVRHICHYPPSDQEPARSDLARFLWPVEEQFRRNEKRLVLGNGASELIDLVIRKAPSGTWKPGPWDVQYKEYERSTKSAGNHQILAPKASQRTTLTCVVNPNNPTGEYMNIEEIKKWISENVEDNGVVVVDESMQPWNSSKFRDDSLTSQDEFILDMYKTRNISIYVIHSWTKLWSCTGIRLGSIVCPTPEHTIALKKHQVPWSVNILALHFLSAVVNDEKYLQDTWKHTSVWRKQTVEKLVKISDDLSAQLGIPRWVFHGHSFLSWVWIDMKSVAVANAAVDAAKKAGVPVRAGVHGYDRPTYVRIAVRKPEHFDVLAGAWKSLKVTV
ncbi:pyridoxal phosphate-dependent transferase [Paraphysoderma sedebokerense]|nr:pyridoxal phosphate-dependent transferase [Paraphysoderma sedebokerense]